MEGKLLNRLLDLSMLIGYVYVTITAVQLYYLWRSL